MWILRDFRALTEAIQGLSEHVRQARVVLARSNPQEARLEELERARAKWEAEMEAMIIKAESIYKSANNAESRARTMARHDEKHADPFDAEGEEAPEGIPDRNVTPGIQEGVLPLHLDMEAHDPPNPRQQALRAKFL